MLNQVSTTSTDKSTWLFYQNYIKKNFKAKTEYFIVLTIMSFHNKNDAEYHYLFKILIIGDSGVGYVFLF